MVLSDRLNPTYVLTEREMEGRGGGSEQPTDLGLSLDFFFLFLVLVHMPFTSYLPLNGGKAPVSPGFQCRPRTSQRFEFVVPEDSWQLGQLRHMAAKKNEFKFLSLCCL